MATLTLSDVAARYRVGEPEVRGWHRAGVITAVHAGRPAWTFDETVVDKEVAELPRCSVDDCGRPVAKQGAACWEHRSKARSGKRVEVEQHRAATHEAIQASLTRRVAELAARYREHQGEHPPRRLA